MLFALPDFFFEILGWEMKLSSILGKWHRHFLALSVALLSSNGALGADVVRMGNGDVISGRLMSYVNGICIFNTQYGATILLKTQDIVSMSTDESYQTTFLSGDKITGRLEVDGERNVLLTQNLGALPLDMSKVAALTRSFKAEPGKEQAPVKKADTSIGEDDSKQAPLTFLTGSTVLLAPGKYEAELGFGYKQTRDSSSLPAAGYFQMSSYSARQFLFDATFRGGLAQGVEGWLTLPLTYSSVEQVSTNQYVRSNSSWSEGDVSFGLQYQLLNESERSPALSTSLAISAPTGKKRYYPLTDNWQDPLNNGSGHWMISPGLSFMTTTDPAIIFGGASYTYAIPRKIDGYNIKPGSVLGLYLGVGFALNERLSLGSRLSYSHQSRLTVDGESMYGTDKDPMELAISASYRYRDTWIVTPSLNYGLNKDSGVTLLSLRFKHQLD